MVPHILWLCFFFTSVEVVSAMHILCKSTVGYEYSPWMEETIFVPDEVQILTVFRLL